MMRTGILFSLKPNVVLANAPDLTGVYTLYNANKEVIYYGKAQKQTLSERLLQHLNSNSECLSNACYFSTESNKNPERRFQQLVRRYVSSNGKQPECNERLERAATRPVEQMCATGVLTTAFIR